MTLGILLSRGYVIWRYSVSEVEFNVRALKQSLQTVSGHFNLQQSFSVRCTVLTSHKSGEQLSTATTPLCLWFFSVSC